MSFRNALSLMLLCAVAPLPALAQQAPSNPSAKPARGKRAASSPRIYIATGPASDSDRDRLRAAIGKLLGVTKVEARAEYDAVTVSIESDGRSSESLLTAAARSAGYVMRPVTDRYFAATGPKSEADLGRLRETLAAVPGVDRAEVSAHAGGAAVRLFGVMSYDALTTAGKASGFRLHELGSYVASGSSAKADLAQLRAALQKVNGVEQVEMQGLVGGATLLIYGNVKDAALAQAGRGAGFGLWSLGSAPASRLFKIEGSRSREETQQLLQALQGVEGIGEVEDKSDSHGPQVAVSGGRARPEGIVAAAAEVGLVLTPVLTIALPSLVPAAERSTPPDYDNRVLEEYATVGDTAPPFTLLASDGRSRVSLSDYTGKKPVVLIFGSCTCPPFRSYIASLEKLQAAYKDRVAFQLVYIQEAHPGSIIAVPTKSGGKELQIIPKTGTVAERLENVEKFIQALKVTIPVVIDSEDNPTKIAYAGWPIRLYVVGIDGKIAYKGAPGPNGFKVPELADWLHENVK